MSSRSSRVRTKVAALLVSLFALWAFAAFVTIRDGVNLLSVNALDSAIGRPTEALVDALQQERRSTLIYIGGHQAGHDSLTSQRTKTDEQIAAFREGASSSTVGWAGSAALDQRLKDVLSRLDGLARTRAAVDNGAMTRKDAAAAYTGVLDDGFLVYGSLATLDDPTIAKDGRTLVSLTRAQEVLAQEDALLSGALAAKQLSPSEQAQFVQLVGVQRFLISDAAAELHDADKTTFRQLIDGPAFGRFRTLEDVLAQRGSVVTAGQASTDLPAAAADWAAAADPVIGALREFVLHAADNLIDRATPAAVGVIIRLALAGGLGLLAVIASIVISVTTARALVRQLERLRTAARDLASHRLPRVVERLQHGEKVDVETEAPELDFGRDEIGQVGQAFNDVQSTAIRVAVEQAELRRSVRDVFLSLARRSQALLHRQLGLLDAMERRSTDAEELAELFRIDHLATRMRRNAENLIVLSGATAGRAWRKPVPMVDVLRGALAEVEDYTRVTVLPVVPASLVGRAVGDVIHLLAELIENAVSFSPPQTVVRVGGSVVGNGFAIEIEDRGLGLSEQDRILANEQLMDPPEFKLSSTARLGLYVVGKLAERHGIRVKLTESPYGGTTAIVLLPATLMADGGGGELGLDGADGSAQFALTASPDDAPSGSAPSTPPLTASGQSSSGQSSSGHTSAMRTAAALSAGRHRSGSAFDEAPFEDAAFDGAGSGAGLGAASTVDSLEDGQPYGSRSHNGYAPPVDAQARDEDVFAADLPLGGSYSPPAFIPPMVTVGDEAPERGTDGSETWNADTPVAGTDAQPRPDEPILTPAGLPWRPRDKGSSAARPSSPLSVPSVVPVPSASTVSSVPSEVPADSPIGRSARPAGDVRSLMSSYRSGTLRGRIDAARLTDTNPIPEWTDPSQEQPGTEEKG